MATMQSNLRFRMMALEFKVRDLIHPPEQAVREAGIEPGDRVLDFGCGPGSYTVAAARVVGETGRVYALDVHPLAIKSVRTAASRAGLSSIEIIQSGRPTALEEGSVDVVLFYDVFHELEEPDVVLRELHRILKPDGTLSFSDHHMKEPDIVDGVTSSGLFALEQKGKRTYRFVRQNPAAHATAPTA